MAGLGVATRFGLAGLVGLGLATLPPLERPLAAQQAAGVTVSIDPDSVRVGVPFTLAIEIVNENPGEIQFPALIELPPELEQKGPVHIRSIRDGLVWRAEYSVIAWRADTLSVPALEALVGEGQPATLVVEFPAIAVASILPPETADLELRDARPFLRIRNFPWWLIGVALGLAALAWWFWRRRREVAPGVLALGPGARALQDFQRLRTSWIGGELSSDRFYDGYESALRRYARATRGWAPSRELFGLGGSDTGLVSALRRSLLARFARVRATRAGPVTDIEAGEAYVRSELPSEEPPPAEDGA